MFQIGGDEGNSSYISADNPNSSDGYITAETTQSYNNAFIVKVPAAWWPTYFSTFAKCEESIRKFLSIYIPVGIFYEVEDY